MQKLCRTLVVLAVIAGIFLTPRARAASTPVPARNGSPPGVDIAQTLSTITGVAISPLLGVGTVGCYQ
jgi:hypothetical protein